MKSLNGEYVGNATGTKKQNVKTIREQKNV
jgi:hypothetical protein